MHKLFLFRQLRVFFLLVVLVVPVEGGVLGQNGDDEGAHPKVAGVRKVRRISVC